MSIAYEVEPVLTDDTADAAAGDVADWEHELEAESDSQAVESALPIGTLVNVLGQMALDDSGKHWRTLGVDYTAVTVEGPGSTQTERTRGHYVLPDEPLPRIDNMADAYKNRAPRLINGEPFWQQLANGHKALFRHVVQPVGVDEPTDT